MYPPLGITHKKAKLPVEKKERKKDVCMYDGYQFALKGLGFCDLQIVQDKRSTWWGLDQSPIADHRSFATIWNQWV